MIPYTQWRYTQDSTPDSFVVTLAEAKNHAYINDTGDAAYDSQQNITVQGYLDAAVERFERDTGKRIRITDFTATLDCEPGYPEADGFYHLWLRDRPIDAVNKIYILNSDASEDTLDATKFGFDGHSGVVIASELPTTTSTPADIGRFNIAYSAGLATELSGALNTAITAGDEIVLVKTLSAAPESQRGVLTVVNATTGAREGIVFTSWTESGGVYTFNTSPAVAAFSIDDVVSVISPPVDVQTALYQMAAHWYEHREAVVAAAGQTGSFATVPMSAQAIIDKYKNRRL